MSRSFSIGIFCLFFFPFIITFHQGFGQQAFSTLLSDSDLLVEITINTFTLVFKVVAISTVMGVFFAWHVKLYAITGARWLHYLLLFPLAFPSYVHAFIFIGFWDYSGVIQQFVRETFVLQGGIDVRSSSWGVAFAMSTALTPYVYLLASASFDRQSNSSIRAARVYAQGSSFKMTKVLMSLIRPGIFAGAVLVMMEVLADFGVVSMFEYNTFTLAIYSSWEDYRNIQLAIILTLHLLVLALLFVFFERWGRGNQRFDNRQLVMVATTSINSLHKWFFYSVTFIWIVISLAIPLLQLIYWSFDTFTLDSRFFDWTLNTLTLSVVGIFCVLSLALLLSSLRHKSNSKTVCFIVDTFSAGYALPGTTLGIAMLSMALLLPANTFTWLFLLVWAYCLRFIPLALNPLNATWESMSPSLENAALIYARSKFDLLKRFYFPVLRSGLWTGLLLLTLDLVKELPITLILRPVGWDTLSVRIYNLASEGLYEAAALPSLMLLLMTGTLFAIYQSVKKSQ